MDATIDKYRLIRPTMQVKNIWMFKKSNAHIFDWTIPQFVNLKLNVEYTKSECFNWVFTITKKRGSYVVAFINKNYEGDVKCSVRYCDNDFSQSIPARRVPEGKHLAVLADSIISVPENQLLKLNILGLCIPVNISETTRLFLQPRSSNDTCSSDYKKMHTKRLQTQIRDDNSPCFVLHNREQRFYIHKAILVARSSFFRQYIQDYCKDGETEEMELCVSSEVMNCLITFLYTGQALLKRQEEFTILTELLKRFDIGAYRRRPQLAVQEMEKSEHENTKLSTQ